MKFSLDGRWSVFSCALVGFAVVLSIAMSYRVFVQETNEYLGYLVVSYGAFDYLVMGVAVILLMVSLRNGARRPSDFFYILYILFVVAPYCVLFKSRGEIDEGVALLALALLVIPLLALSLTRKIAFEVKFRGFLRLRHTNLMIYGIVVIAVFLLFNSGIPSASFDIDASYDRRLEGRDSFQSGATASYLVQMVSNSMLPLIAFWSGYNRRVPLFVFAIAGCLLYFFYLGLKAPFLYVTIGAGFGWLGCSIGFRGMNRIFICAILMVFGISFVEITASGYSYFADYLVRRAFIVPPFLVSAYIEMFSQSSGYWNLIEGNISDQPITMLMGEYLGDLTLNANTNTFLYAFGAIGLYGYFIDVLFVCTVFAFIDRLYFQRRDPALMWIGFLFSLLLVEQSSKTVFVSSGFALSLLLLFFQRSKTPSTNMVS